MAVLRISFSNQPRTDRGNQNLRYEDALTRLPGEQSFHTCYTFRDDTIASYLIFLLGICRCSSCHISLRVRNRYQSRRGKRLKQRQEEFRSVYMWRYFSKMAGDERGMWQWIQLTTWNTTVTATILAYRGEGNKVKEIAHPL